MTAGLKRLSGQTPGGAWEAVFAAPDPRLRASVLGDYQGWAETGGVPVFRRHLPVVMVPIILNLGPLWEVSSPGNAGGRALPFDSFIAGLHDVLATTRSVGESACIQLNLTPLGAHRLLGLPMREIANRVLDVGDLLPDGADLVARLREAEDWAQRFGLLDDYLRAHLAAAESAGEIDWALRQLQRSHGQMQIGRLADELGVSRKRLIARFQTEIGLAPKSIGRIYRFNRMLGLLHRPGRMSLAERAAACGYYDQAHFNRDFRDFAGLSPSAYLAELHPESPESVLG